MEIVSSNRLEVLYEHFVKKISLKPFTPLTIVVPSTALREWLTFRLAKDKNILFGVEILLLEEALFKTASEKTPSLLALALSIEPKLDEIPEIREFLKSDKRRHTLACRLAKLFQKYSSNCPRMKKEWKKGWQAELFQKIFDKKPTLWEAVQPSAFYLFGISYLTPIEKKAFENAKIWMFSPCLHYWEDQLSEKEQASLLRYYEKKGVKEELLQAFEKTLEPIHPLLAEWGQLGKPMTLLDEHEVRQYIAPLKIAETWEVENDVILYDGEASSLDRLKTEILYGRKSEWPCEKGDSIAFFQYTDLKREVEGLRKQLLNLIEKGLEPKDILILTPSIEKVKGFLPLAFKEDLPYFICDDAEIKGEDKLFISFWELVQKGAKIIDFLDWIKEAELFEADAFRKITRLLPLRENFWQQSMDELLIKVKKGEIDSSEVDPLRQFLVFYQKFLPLLNIKERKTLSAWGKHFESALEWVNSASAREVIEKICKGESRDLFSFYSFFEHLKNGIKALQIEPYATNLNSIRVSSLYPMRLVPARAVILLGMNEESYPRNEFLEPLDESSGYEEEKLPSKRDLDLYLLLETLFQAEDYFWISYSGELARPLEYMKELIDLKSQYSDGSRLYKKQAAIKAPYVFSAYIKEQEQVLSLEDIQRTLAKPIQAYYQKNLSVYLSRPEENEEALIPSTLDRLLLKRSIAEQKSHEFKIEGRFAAALREKSVEELAHLEGAPFKIDPPIEIDGIRIYGTFRSVSDKGVHIVQSGPAKRYENLFLIYLWAYIQQSPACYRQLDKKDSVFKSPPLDACKTLLKLFRKINEAFCPLEPDWISYIAEGNEEKLSSAFKETRDLYQALAISKGLNPREVIQNWQETAKELMELMK